MGRGKIEIKRIDNTTNRQVTFSKRRKGLLKKAHELAVLTDAQIGLIIISATKKLYHYNSPTVSMGEIIDEYQKVNKIRIEDLGSHQQLHYEISKIRRETEMLQASIKQFTGEDLATLTINDLNQLEEQLDYSVNKIRTRKHQLLHQQLENLRRKEHILADQNNCFYRAIMSEHQAMMEEQHLVEAEHKVREMGLLDPYGQILDDSRSLLHLAPQMHPFQVQPIQPNLQEAEFHGYGLQL